MIVLLAGCADAPSVDTRSVTLHVPVACGADPSPRARLVANGDFASGAVDTLSLDDVGAALANIPPETRALLATIAGPGPSLWRGLTDVSPQGDVDILLWPNSSLCALSQRDESLRERTDAAIGALDSRRVLVAGGAGEARSFVADLAMGEIKSLVRDLLIQRVRATVTPFGDGALVAGGVYLGDPRGDAEVFTGAGFDWNPILLRGQRASHAAAVLPSGETLLIGGENSRGPLGTLELVDPQTRQAINLTDSAGRALDLPRTRPVALRLASGEIMVAGGFDANGKPIGHLEWLKVDEVEDADHKKRKTVRHTRSRDFVASNESGFVALPGGGALAVIAPSPGPSADFNANVWVISADGVPDAAHLYPGPLTKVRLFPGNGGAPLLWTGDRWLRWQPWVSEFGPETAPAEGPDDHVIVSPDPGLVVWVTADAGRATLAGFRFDARGPFTTDSSLLVSGTEFLAPDRRILPTGSPLTFDSSRGLVLSEGASAFVADATFASFSLSLSLTGPPPVVVLRDETGFEFEVGGRTCPFTVFGVIAQMNVERDGETVRVGFGSEGMRECRTLPEQGKLRRDGRVSIGLRGGTGDASAGKSLVITRR